MQEMREVMIKGLGGAEDERVMIKRLGTCGNNEASQMSRDQTQLKCGVRNVNNNKQLNYLNASTGSIAFLSSTIIHPVIRALPCPGTMVA